MKTMSDKSLGQPVIFLDRDGVINEEPGPVVRAEQLRIIPRSLEAIRVINDHNILCVVVTNQAAFAKGLMTQEDFEKICAKLNDALAQKGGHIDDLFYCCHYPTWEEGRLAELCHPCDCRKPGTLLFEQAVEKHNIDLKQAIFVGDTTSDFEAARRLGIPSIGVKTGHAGKDGKCDTDPTEWADDLWEAVKLWENKYKS